jgi:N-acetylglucosaminyldiphosphoundecaprenol N-acetyl-beta-D-mannosaminyltransferase
MSTTFENLPQPVTLTGKIASPKRILVAGCPVDRISLADALGDLCLRIERKKRTHVVFINAAKTVHCRRDTELRRAIDRADLLLADGVPIVWASRLTGAGLPGRVNGTDLMEAMLGNAAERGYRVFLLGAQPDVLDRCVQQILLRYPNINIVGYRDGYFSQADEKQVVQQINESRADILFLGMGTPQKELWADRNLPFLNVSVCQGVGGSFDVLAGLVKRAPEWVQRCGLEWSFRLLQEPKRLWRRYLTTNLVFLWLVLRDAIVPVR